MIERRKEERKKEANKVTFELMIGNKIHSGEKISFALTDDISVSGIKILTDRFFPVDSLLKIELSLMKSNKVLKLAGKVRWVNHLGKGLHEMGLEIVDTAEGSIRYLIEHLYKAT